MKFGKRLPPELARPIPRRFAILTPALAETIEALRKQRLVHLLQHYGIDQRDPLALQNLVYCIVPGLQLEESGKRRPGRPRKLFTPRPKRGRGAPRKWSPRDYEMLLRIHQIGSEILRQRDIERVNARVALEAGIKHDNAEQRLGMTDREIRGLAAQWAKRLSDARKAFRKLVNK